MNHSPHATPSPGPGARSILPVALLIVSSGVLLTVALRYAHRAYSADPSITTPRAITPRGPFAADEKATIDLFERCKQSVVYVSPMQENVRMSLFGLNSVIETGTGSGFVWDQQGHVVTNYHVIQGADACVVTLPDNSVYDARLVGVYADKDIAVLKIDAAASQLTPIDIGESDKLRVGQRVIAIGNPFGLDFTLTTGVVSALNREIQAVNNRTIQGVIQTDAAINPGNSGGPLLDSAGRLIGITTAIYSRSGGSAGIGFAVPVRTVNRIVPQLIAHGRVIRPGLGIGIDDAIARRLRIDNGVLVLSVAQDSAAAAAGLRPTTQDRSGRIILGDVIRKVGGEPVRNEDELLNVLERFEIGDKVNLTIMRNAGEQQVVVTLQPVG